jgi:hypothetical protein
MLTIQRSGFRLPSDPVVAGLIGGFLGAYFFAVNMTFRRYVRADLRPKAYSHIAVRIIVTLILVWIVASLPVLGSDPAVILVLGFFIGIIPETAMVIFRDFLLGVPILRGVLLKVIPSVEEGQPLRDLQGITVYDRARLLEEGIENIETLVHHTFVELMLWTRIPTQRLVDLLDQAVLYLRVNTGDVSDKSYGDVPKAMAALRSRYVRTATDFLRVYGDRPADGQTGDQQTDAQMGVLASLLECDQWLPRLRRWYDFETIGEKAITLDEFAAELRQQEEREPEQATRPAPNGDTNIPQPRATPRLA